VFSLGVGVGRREVQQTEEKRFIGEVIYVDSVRLGLLNT
jgi:hypothetical protein